jgi:hypothetical protein
MVDDGRRRLPNAALSMVPGRELAGATASPLSRRSISTSRSPQQISASEQKREIWRPTSQIESPKKTLSPR